MSRSADAVQQASRRLLLLLLARRSIPGGGGGGGAGSGAGPPFLAPWSPSSPQPGARLLTRWTSPQHSQHHHWLSTSSSPRNDVGDDASDAKDATANPTPKTFIPLYKGKWILPVRLLVRAKIFQLAGFGSVALAASMIAAGDLTPTDAALLAALTTGCVGSAFSLWYYSSRYVGELSVLLPPDDNKLTLRLSSLDFWGNRADVAVDARRLLPVVRGGGRTRAQEVERLTSQILFPVNVASCAEVGMVGDDDDDDDDDKEEGDGDGRERRRTAIAATTPALPPSERRQFYLSAVAGASPHPRLLMALLDGSLVASTPWLSRPRTAEELERVVVGEAAAGVGAGAEERAAAAAVRARDGT